MHDHVTIYGVSVTLSGPHPRQTIQQRSATGTEATSPGLFRTVPEIPGQLEPHDVAYPATAAKVCIYNGDVITTIPCSTEQCMPLLGCVPEV